MATRDMNNNEAIQMLNRCKHEITCMRETINQLRPKADAYDNISTILRIFFVHPQGMVSDGLVWTIQKRIDELTPKPEANPAPTPSENFNKIAAEMKQSATQESHKFDPNPWPDTQMQEIKAARKSNE